MCQTQRAALSACADEGGSSLLVLDVDCQAPSTHARVSGYRTMGAWAARGDTHAGSIARGGGALAGGQRSLCCLPSRLRKQARTDVRIPEGDARAINPRASSRPRIAAIRKSVVRSRTYSAVARCIGPTGRRGESRPPLGERRPRSLSSTAAVSRRHTFTAAPSGCSERDHHRRGNGTNRPGRPRCGCAKPSLGCTRPLHHAVCPYSHHAGHTPRIPSREL